MVGLVVMGVFVLLLWLHVVFFDRLQRWQPPWSRWVRQPEENMLRMLKVLAIGFAVFVSLCYVVMLIAFAIGPISS